MDGRIIVAATPSVLARFERPLSLLTEDERVRARGFRFNRDRDDFVAAHVLVRACAAVYADVPMTEVTLEQHCPSCGRGHGPPQLRELPELGVSLAHSRGFVAAAVAPGPIGVDIEAPGRRFVDPFDESCAQLVLTSREARLVRAAPDPASAFLALWVRKEAVVKARRSSLAAMREIELTGDAGELVDRWEDLRFTVWSGPGRVVGACAAPVHAHVDRWDAVGLEAVAR